MAAATRLRSDLAGLASLAERDLRAAFREFSTAEEARDGLIDILPKLVRLYGAAAATLAADWYDEHRDELGVKGRFTAIPAEYVADASRTAVLARWAVGPMFSVEPDAAAALSNVAGGAQRIIVSASRETILGSIREDREARGWSRETSGAACDFCKMIAGRGAVFSADTANFAAHDHCNCSAVPAYGASVRVRPYAPSQRFRTPEARAAHNARTRTWLGGGTEGRGATPLAPKLVDSGRSVAQLKQTLTSLEASAAKFSTPGTQARIDALRAEIAGRN